MAEQLLPGHEGQGDRGGALEGQPRTDVTPDGSGAFVRRRDLLGFGRRQVVEGGLGRLQRRGGIGAAFGRVLDGEYGEPGLSRTGR